MPPSSCKSPTPPTNQTHYDTLGLPETCTTKEVKEAFVRLSKAHHPDLHPNDPTQGDKFVKVNEAYSVLRCPDKRVVYDSDLKFQERMQKTPFGNGFYGDVQTDCPNFNRRWKDETIWHMRPDRGNINRDYYGIRGVKRVSNHWVAGGAVLLMVIGALLHYAAFKHSVTFNADRINTRNEKITSHLISTRNKASDNGNDEQLERMKMTLGWDGSSSRRND